MQEYIFFSEPNSDIHIQINGSLHSQQTGCHQGQSQADLSGILLKRVRIIIIITLLAHSYMTSTHLLMASQVIYFLKKRQAVGCGNRF